jgi:predicted Rossmann fold nucleotide-binding protein DprA/Smf involved in DNA uptake
MLNKNRKIIGLVGSRTLNHKYKVLVFNVVKTLLNQNYNIATGGAIGSDAFCIESLLALNHAQSGIIFSAWQGLNHFPKKVLPLAYKLNEKGGKFVWSSTTPSQNYIQIRNALLNRNENLVNNSQGLVAFINAKSRGSIFTIKKAINKKIPVIVFPIETCLPKLASVNWLSSNKKHFEGAFKAHYLN